MNATLTINNSKGFGYDIWQTCDCEKWDVDKWNKSLKTLGAGLRDIYKNPERRIDDIDIYNLGDVINLLESIKVEVK